MASGFEAVGDALLQPLTRRTRTNHRTHRALPGWTRPCPSLKMETGPTSAAGPNLSTRLRHRGRIARRGSLGVSALAVLLVGLACGGAGDNSIEAAPEPARAAADRNSLRAEEITASLTSSTYIDAGRAGGTLRDVAFDSAGNVVVVGHGSFIAERVAPVNLFGVIDKSNVIVAKFSPDLSKALWIVLLGGSGRDRGYGVDVDAHDDVYVAGRTSSRDFPVTPGAFDETHNGGTNPRNHPHGASDAYVLKLSSDGQELVYSTYLGGRREDAARGGLAVDGGGHAYVIGFTASRDYLSEHADKVDSFANTYIGGDSDGFITKMSVDGSRVIYTRFVGGSGRNIEEVVMGARVDAEGNVYSATIVRSPRGIAVTDGSVYNGGKADVYLTKVSADGGELLYATLFGGSRSEYLEHRMALDADGNVYVVGATNSPDFPADAGQRTRSGSGMAGFLAKFDPTGRPLFARYVGGGPFGPELDPEGRIFVAGITKSPAASDGGDAMLEIYSRTGELLDSTAFGGSRRDYGRYVGLDAKGHAFVVGQTSSSDFPTTADAYDESFNGAAVFVSRFEVLAAEAMPARD